MGCETTAAERAESEFQRRCREEPVEMIDWLFGMADRYGYSLDVLCDDMATIFAELRRLG